MQLPVRPQAAFGLAEDRAFSLARKVVKDEYEQHAIDATVWEFHCPRISEAEVEHFGTRFAGGNRDRVGVAVNADDLQVRPFADQSKRLSSGSAAEIDDYTAIL